MKHFAVPAFCLLVAVGGRASGQDWPTYMHDGCRSGVARARLELPLQLAWTFKPLLPPAPAWPGPAKQDFYHDHFDLRPLELYDHAFHVVAGAGTIYFGSSSQDKIYALNTADGRVRWTFLTEGPVRFAPVFSQGRVYAGSDDGRVYCLSASDGSLLWKRRIALDERMIPGNGRMISLWPIRTGLVVEDGTVYCTAGLFPEEGTYLAALDARTGAVKYRQRISVLPQGYLLASAQRLYVPTGRTNPAIFSRAEGRLEGQVPSAGGAYAVLMEDVLVSGPGRGSKELQADDMRTKETIATFGGLRMVVSGSVAYMQSERQLAAFDRGRYLTLSRERTQLQRERDTLRKSLRKMQEDGPEVQEAQTRIESLNVRIGQLEAKMKACYLWTVESTHPYSMIVAGKMLFVGGDGEVAAVDCGKGTVVWTGGVQGKAFGLAIVRGTLYVSTDTGHIHCFRHSVGAQPKIVAEEMHTEPDSPGESSQQYREAADRILREVPSGKGYCLILDSREGRLAYELARRSEFKIVAVEADADRARRARRMLDAAGQYGRVAVHCLAGDKLPYTSWFANVVISEATLRGEPCRVNRDEIMRVLRPCGGVLIVDGLTGAGSECEVFRRGPLDGSGEWTHQYAEPGNSACSGDSLIAGQPTVQWFGDPGPREMIDRHHRNIAPLCKDGRLFVPGDCVVFAVDAYNGTILWRADIPESRRLGSFLDAGSMAVDDRALYVAVKDQCWAYDVETGRRRTTFTMPQPGGAEPHAWGYVAYRGSILLGSGRKQGASYTETSRAADEALWYRDMKLVTSDYLFAKDKGDDSLLWTYRDGVIVNTTITAADSKVFFVETHSPQAVADRIGRMPVKVLFAGGTQYLVGLDQSSGRTIFKREIDVRHFEEPVYLGYGEGVLLLSGSRLEGKSVRYYYDAYDAATGADLWHASHDSELSMDGGHGEYNRQPTIVGDTVYAWPYAYVLRTGKRLNGWKFDRRGHGCGGVSASARCLFWRGGNPWMYDLGPQGGPIRFNSVSRPGCWINMIPAGGLVLIPEASSGCTCGFSMQTSLAYIPERALN